MAKKDKKPDKKSSKRNSREYSTVPVTDTDGDDTELPSSKKANKNKAKSKPSSNNTDKGDKKKDKSKGKHKDSDDEDSGAELHRKPSPVVAPLPKLTREEYNFFELVKSGDVEAVSEFLKSSKFDGMNINKTDKMGYTVLHYAVRRQDEEMTSLLAQQPGILLHDILLHAIKEENETITKMLLELYDANASEEHKKRFMSSLNGSIEDQRQIETLASTTSRLSVSPQASPLSGRSGVKSSVRLVVPEAPAPSKSKSKPVVSQPSRSDPSVQASASRIEETEEPPPEDIPFDSEFPPVITPLMLAAQQGCYALMDLFYAREERLESEEFPHNIGCSCDICAKLDGDQDMTRAFQRYHLFKALSQPEYICFMSRKEKVDPVNYAIQKILKIREIIELDQAYNQLFSGFEEELEEFISKLLKLCRNTTETEIFLSPKDAEGKERLPHLYPRLWYAVGTDLKKFVAEPNAQNIVYKVWATDDWPDWDTYSTLYRIFNIAIRVIGFPFIALILLLAQDTGIGRVLGCPVSRFLTYLGSYTCFLILVGIQALFPYQRCNDVEPYYQIDDDHCKERGPPNIGTELFLIVYVISFFVGMLKKNSVSWYWKMRWSWYDLITQMCFVVTFMFWGYSWLWIHMPENQPFLKATDRLLWPHDCAEIFGECFLAISFMLACGRILRFFTVLPDLGPVQIILGKQIVDFINTMFIMVVVIFAFASGMLGLYLPYKDFHGLDHTDAKREKLQDDSYHSVVGAFKTFFFVLYEHAGPETTKLLTWDVKNESGAVEEIHHTYTETTGLFLFMTYNLIGCTMLFSMLSGYFAQTAEQVTQSCNVEWKFARAEFYFSFIKETMLPPPFNLIPTIRGCLSGARFMKLLGRKTDPRSSCSFKQCCYITSSKKTEKWKKLMKGYRKLILQLIYRYLNQREEEDGEERATKDDVMEIGEELAEIKAMLRKGSGKGKDSDNDDSDDDKPGGGGGASRSVHTTASSDAGMGGPSAKYKTPEKKKPPPRNPKSKTPEKQTPPKTPPKPAARSKPDRKPILEPTLSEKKRLGYFLPKPGELDSEAPPPKEKAPAKSKFGFNRSGKLALFFEDKPTGHELTDFQSMYRMQQGPSSQSRTDPHDGPNRNYSANNTLPSPKMTIGLMDVGEMTGESARNKPGLSANHSANKLGLNANHSANKPGLNANYSANNTIPSPKMTVGLFDVNEMTRSRGKSESQGVCRRNGAEDAQPFQRKTSKDKHRAFTTGEHYKYTGSPTPSPGLSAGLFDISSPGVRSQAHDGLDSNQNRRNNELFSPSTSPIMNCARPQRPPVVPSIPLHFSSDDNSGKATAGSEV